MKRGVLTVEALKERCKVHPLTGCWEWQCGGTHGLPALWTFDHARGEKRTMSGPLAAWNISRSEAPRDGAVIFRGCLNKLCLNPVHLREARDRAEIGLHIRRRGSSVGTSLEQRRANIKHAHAAQGIVATSPDVVRAIRAAPRSVTGRSLSQAWSVAESVVSRIRRGTAHREVV